MNKQIEQNYADLIRPLEPRSRMRNRYIIMCSLYMKINIEMSAQAKSPSPVAGTRFKQNKIKIFTSSAWWRMLGPVTA